MLTACLLFWLLTISRLVLVTDHFKPWLGVGTEHWSCLVGPGGGSGGHILVDFRKSIRKQIGSLSGSRLPKAYITRLKWAKRERESQAGSWCGPEPWQLMPGKAWMPVQEGGLWTDSKQGAFRVVSGGQQATLCPKGLGDIALERTEGICSVAKYNLDTIFSVSRCCFAESMI